MNKEHESSLIGMWVFLITEFLFFIALFLAFAVYRSLYETSFNEAARHLSVPLGTLNTGILLTSSFFMAAAVGCIQKNRQRLLVMSLVMSIALALAFLGVKAVEYSTEIKEGLFPNSHFRFEGEHFIQAKLFFVHYFLMTGLHAFHIIIGIGAMTWILVKALRGHYNLEHYVGVECVALYWHFVDIIWVFVFPLLYLLGAHAP